jgi:hypothetical protein
MHTSHINCENTEGTNERRRGRNEQDTRGREGEGGEAEGR